MRGDDLAIGGVWLYNEADESFANGADRWVVSVEVDGVWRRCIVEAADGPSSHIIEPSGIRKAPVDPLGLNS